MNGTFRKNKQYKFRQVPFNDITVTYQGANSTGANATKFFFKYHTGFELVLKRGHINHKYIETRRCLEQRIPLKLKAV